MTEQKRNQNRVARAQMFDELAASLRDNWAGRIEIEQLLARLKRTNYKALVRE